MSLKLDQVKFFTKVLFDLGMVDFEETFTRLLNQGMVLMDGSAMSKSRGNLVKLGDQLEQHGVDAIRLVMSFAGPPEDDIDWKDVSPQASAKFLARAWRVAKDVSETETSGDPDKQVRVQTHSFLSELETNIENFKFNVAVAKTMELVNSLRKAIDSGSGASNPAVREGAEELAKGLSLFAPYVAEDMWHLLGHETPVSLAGFRPVEEDLLVQETVVAVAQVNGKLRDKFEVSVDVTEEELEKLATDSENVKRAIGDGEIVKIIVKAPKLINIAVKG